MERNYKSHRALIWITSIALVFTFALAGMNAGLLTKSAAYAEQAMLAAPAVDPSPAIYVMQKNINSVVGVIGYIQNWNRQTGNVEETMYSQGSGVVIAEGGYILTNNHVVDNCDSYKILMPNGEKVEAFLVGTDSATDLAVLQVSEGEKQLVPVEIGSSRNIIVGSTAIAIGNPKGEALANTVTSGIVSALERSNVYTTNTTRNVDYIQHDAAINSGNSGGGLFNYKGELIGINTLRANVNYEGLAFAIPVDAVYPIALQLIENGEVVRPQMGVNVLDYEGPDEPMGNYPPASVCVMKITPGSPAERAGMRLYDFIYAVNGERVTTFREMTAVLDHFQAGDTVTLTLVRYNNVYPVQQQSSNYYDPFSYFGFDFGYGNGSSNANAQQPVSGTLAVGGGYEYVTMDVTLELPAEEAE